MPSSGPQLTVFFVLFRVVNLLGLAVNRKWPERNARVDLDRRLHCIPIEVFEESCPRFRFTGLRLDPDKPE